MHVRSQWMGALALLVALGGTAYAASGPLDGPAPGKNSVGSLDVIDGQVQSADIQDNAVGSSKVKNDSLTDNDIAQNTIGFRESATSASDEIEYGSIDEYDVADGTLTTDDVANQSLTGDDILPRSGVDSCTATVRLGSLCVRAENSARKWREAMTHCANLDLRVPTLGEALQLAQTHDIPNVDESEFFWTDEQDDGTTFDGHIIETGYVVDDADHFGELSHQATAETVCVMNPVN